MIISSAVLKSTQPVILIQNNFGEDQANSYYFISGIFSSKLTQLDADSNCRRWKLSFHIRGKEEAS